VESKLPTQRQLTAIPSEDFLLGAVISPDGRMLAYEDRSEGFVLTQIDSGEKRLFPNIGQVYPLDWFPDGAHMLVEPTTGHGLLKMSTLDGSTQRLLKETSHVFAAAVSPDAAHIAWLGYPGTVDDGVWLMGIDGEGLHRIIAQSGVTYGNIAWSPTSQRLAFISLRGSAHQPEEVSLQSCDPDGGRCSVILSDKKLINMNGFTDIVWSSDHRIFYRRFAPVGQYEDIWSIAVDPASGRVTGSPTQITSQTGFSPSGFSLSLDGKKLALVGSRLSQTIQLLDLRKTDVKLEASQAIKGDIWHKDLFGWTPDSTAILFVSNPQERLSIFKYDVRTKQTTSLVVGPNKYYGPAVTSDGQWLLFTESSPDPRSNHTSKLMRMPLNGSSASPVLSGDFFCRCASKANVCVVSEAVKDGQVLSLFDPMQGRGRRLAQIEPLENNFEWSLSADGKKLSWVAKSNLSRIEIRDIQSGAKNAIDLKDLQAQSLSWAPDNEHLYVSGNLEPNFPIWSVDLDGKNRTIVSVPNGQGWLTQPQPSPDGRYLGFDLRRFDSNVVMLENF
jgi:Tol biopolymer transport system component